MPTDRKPRLGLAVEPPPRRTACAGCGALSLPILAICPWCGRGKKAAPAKDET